MKKFEDYFKIEFTEKYMDYCSAIQCNLLSAYYDISLLTSFNNLKNKKNCTKTLTSHIIQLLWSDLVLNITKSLGTKNDEKSIKILNGIMRQQNKNLKSCPISYDNSTFNTLNSFRNNIIAHTLTYSDYLKIDLESVKKLLLQIIDIFNDRQFFVNGKSFEISKSHLSGIDINSALEIAWLFRQDINS